MHSSALQQLATELQPLGGNVPELAAQYWQYYRLPAPQAGALQVLLGRAEVGPYQVAMQAWLPQGRPAQGSLLLLHGYYDHMGLYGHLQRWALGHDLAVLACDLPGHGLSSGARASIQDFHFYQLTLQQLLAQAELLDLPKPWHVMGQSTGAGIVLDFLLHREAPTALGKIMLLAPLVRPVAWTMSRLSYHLLRPFVDSIPRRYANNSGDTAFLDFVRVGDPLQPQILPVAWVGALARWIPRMEAAPNSTHPLIIVQGDQDMTVDWRHNLKVLGQKFHQPTVLTVPGAGHHLANETEALRQLYLAFLSEQLQR